MPYRTLSFAKGFYYHVFNRGINHEQIFYSPDNYFYCLKLLKMNVRRYGVTVIAYCLMPNHYHLLVRPERDDTLSSCIGSVFNSYTQALNRQRGRSGPLFEGVFKAIAVEESTHLLHLCRYIHLNPMHAGLAESVFEWPYSNFLEWIGRRAGSLVDAEFVRENFASGDYLRFVEEYVAEEKEKKGLVQYLFD